MKLDEQFWDMLTCLLDIASEFSFGTSNDRIRHPKFDPSFHDNCIAGLDLNQALPDWIASRTDPAYAMYLAEKKVCCILYYLVLSLLTIRRTWPHRLQEL
jgi:hypothetical protein